MNVDGIDARPRLSYLYRAAHKYRKPVQSRLRKEAPMWKSVLVRTDPYLNDLVEQHHRAIRRRCQLQRNPSSASNLQIFPKIQGFDRLASMFRIDRSKEP
jgi:transposase-like protein